MTTIKTNKPEIKRVPLLIVMTGLPCCGKTEISKFLEQEYGIKRISTDDIRVELGYEKNFDKFRQDPDFRSKRYEIIKTSQQRKFHYLLQGLDTIVDGAVPNQQSREDFLDTRKRSYSSYGYSISVTEQLPAKKYLVYLDAEEEVLKVRSKKKYKKETVPEKFRKESKWEHIKLISGCIILPYSNNTPEDLAFIKQQLPQELGLVK